MDHPKCETCKHWFNWPGEPYRSIPDKFKLCHRTDITPGQWREGEIRSPEDTRMYVADAENYYAELQTRFDFYCPHHSDLSIPKGANK